MAFRDNINGYFDVGAQLPDYLKEAARACFRAAEKEKADIATVEQFERRRDRLRRRFLEVIGGLPEAKTPLNAVCTGEIVRDAYTIRKIVYQSLPGFYVTANLYLPKTKANGRPVPAVLKACGHSELAKAAPLYQKVCIDLARNGFAVFAVDPVSQGERMQYYDPAVGRNLVRWHAEHSYIGLQCDLIGMSIIRYFIWDLVRAIDYLETVPEIDASRIGITGNSGGGLQTAFMMMVEPRIQAAAPCTYITSRESYMRTGQSQDGEQIIYGAIRDGLDYDDYAAMFAPKPAMIGAVKSDFFCVEGTLEAYERLRRVYALYGCEDRIELSLVDGTHAYNDALREAAVNFFIRRLQGGEGGFVTDPAVPVEDKWTLACTKSGQVLAEYPDARTAQALNAEYLAEHGAGSAGKSPEEIRAAVRRWLNPPEERIPIYPRIIHTSERKHPENWIDDVRHHAIFFFSERDIAVTALYIEKIGRRADRCTVFVHEEGINHVYKENDLIMQLLRDGDVLMFDPRGMGTAASRPVNPRPFHEMYGTEYKLNSDALMLGTSLMQMRVFDVARACDFLRQYAPDKKLRLGGKGVGAVYALLAAMLVDDVEALYLENGLPSFASIVNEPTYRYDERYRAYGILREFDLPDVIRAFGPERVTVYNAPDVGNIIWW
jgi:hypothetical protein